MSASVKHILKSFDLLSEEEKKQVASEIIRRSLSFDLPPLSDKELVLSAEELFLELDRQESKDSH